MVRTQVEALASFVRVPGSLCGFTPDSSFLLSRTLGGNRYLLKWLGPATDGGDVDGVPQLRSSCGQYAGSEQACERSLSVPQMKKIHHIH